LREWVDFKKEKTRQAPFRPSEILEYENITLYEDGSRSEIVNAYLPRLHIGVRAPHSKGRRMAEIAVRSTDSRGAWLVAL
jgi:hypothetical protein